MQKKYRSNSLFSLTAILSLMPLLPASQSGEPPLAPGQVIPDLGFEPIVDVDDMQLEPPLVEYSVDDPRELEYLTPEPDLSGDDVAPGAGSGGSSGGSKQ